MRLVIFVGADVDIAAVVDRAMVNRGGFILQDLHGG